MSENTSKIKRGGQSLSLSSYRKCMRATKLLDELACSTDVDSFSGGAVQEIPCLAIPTAEQTEVQMGECKAEKSIYRKTGKL